MNGDEDYQDFFKIAASNKFAVIFDGLNIYEDTHCFSYYRHLIKVFLDNSKKFKVEIIGENVEKFDGYNLKDILDESREFNSINVLRLNIHKGIIQNLDNINLTLKDETQKYPIS